LIAAKNTIFILLCICSLQIFAQKKQKYKPDTVYYLADTAWVPKNDRMMTIGTEVYSHPGKLDTIESFRINCACLPYTYYPTFTQHLNKSRKKLSPLGIKKIKFISLSDLLELVLKDYKHDFNDKHIVIIVEAVKNKYFAGEVFLTEYQDPTQ
jgi:glycine cleavage system H lipoate-binding protein